MAPSSSFVHLHVHSDFSLLDGLGQIEQYVAAARQDGQPALAITDHGSLAGGLEHYRRCRDAGIRPVLGYEAYLAPGSRLDRSTAAPSPKDAAAGGGRYTHLTLLAETLAGYHRLLRLATEAYLSGFYSKPRVDLELLDAHHGGLIATSGCLGGPVCQLLLAGHEREACEVAGALRDIFGPDHFYVEVQRHGIAAEDAIGPALLDIARRLGVGVVATGDAHYVRREDADAHEAWLCVQTHDKLANPGRFRFEGGGYHLASAAEMRALWADLPEACDATLEIADRCRVEIGLGVARLPAPPISRPGRSAEAELRSQAAAGLKRRFGPEPPVEAMRRLADEVNTICRAGFAPYFLIVADLVAEARRRGIRVGPGRGSAAGALTAYCLGITQVDPIRWDLLFERFLNPGRATMPDIDLDVEPARRDELIAYLEHRYGAEHVAHVATFGVLGSRAAVRDAARVLGRDWTDGDRLAKALPERRFGRDVPLADVLGGSDPEGGQFRQLASQADAKEIVDLATRLEGTRRNAGLHASAVVLADRPLVELVPLFSRDGVVATQCDMHGCEALGLLKLDLLGLRNLAVIERTLALVERATGHRPDIDHVPLDDAATFELLRRAETVGVFQLEGGPMRSLIRALKPTCFEDVAALIALYRPGPIAASMHLDYAARKNDPSKVSYLHPDLEPILAETYGLMIYQESVMRVAQRFAGYSLAEADNLRKACAKKIRSLIAAEREKFVAGCEAQGYGRELGTKLFDIIEPFADYAFNKSHSYGYGLVAYQTAYLKAHWPVEYLSALLTSVADDKDKTAVYLSEARNLGIRVEAPDVNASDATDFASIPGRRAIRYPLGAVRDVPTAQARAIVAEREARGPFADLADLCRRVGRAGRNRRGLQALAEAGALPAPSRRGAAEALDATLAATVARPRPGTSVPVPSTVEWSAVEVARRERLRLGRVLSLSPAEPWAAELERVGATLFADLPGTGRVVVGGVVLEVAARTTRRGERMARLTVTDSGGGEGQVVLFPRLWGSLSSVVGSGTALVVAGRVDAEGSVLADDVRLLLPPPPA